MASCAGFRVGVFAPHAGADEHVANGDPLRSAPHRGHRGALRPPELHRRPFAGDIRVRIRDAGLRVASWNTRELLGSTASQSSRERKHFFLQRLGENKRCFFFARNARED